MNFALLFFAAFLLAVSPRPLLADWPMLRGNPMHTGFVDREVPRTLLLEWAVEFAGERIGTAVEPIVAGGTVFVGTHAGNLYALDAREGKALWRFRATGPFLHSPAVAGDRVICATADGYVFGLNRDSGEVVWQHEGSSAGFSAAPIIVDGKVFIASRGDDLRTVKPGGRDMFETLLALDVKTGKLLWWAYLQGIRQTAASDGQRLFLVSEDMRMMCYDVAEGTHLFTSEPMIGQTARDYYPVVVQAGERTLVYVRTNPVRNMAAQIAADRTFLCRNAGIPNSSWQGLEEWIRNGETHGRPELWMQEQAAVSDQLRADPSSATFYVYDSNRIGEETKVPALWAGGCQGEGSPPALTATGELLVFYRSAYGNWNRGVAPLVALGLLKPGTSEISPLFHNGGRQPPWNTFWGTADEAQNFVVAGKTAYIVHQGTLSAFDLSTGELRPIWGERDTYGGFANPPWARNEWHGPARSGVAISDDRIFWQTGSRLLCLGPAGLEKGKAAVRTIQGNSVRTVNAESPRVFARARLERVLAQSVDELLRTEWAPLVVEPGLAGTDVSFGRTGEEFEALTFAYEFLPAPLQARVKNRLAAKFKSAPPFSPEAELPLNKGQRREWAAMPGDFEAKSGRANSPQPFGEVWIKALWAERLGMNSVVDEQWAEIADSYRAFKKLNWKLDPEKGDLHANSYVASLLALPVLAERNGRPDMAIEAREEAARALEALIAWWRNAAKRGTLHQFRGSSELDHFIQQGDLLSFAVAPHRHKLALFQGLSLQLFHEIEEKAPEAVRAVWNEFVALYPTWYLQGEERQVHSGENFVDPPDLALSAFKVAAWGRFLSPNQLAQAVDIPFCRADLYYTEKLAITLATR